MKQLIWLLSLISLWAAGQTVTPTLLTRMLTKADCDSPAGVETLVQGGKISAPPPSENLTASLGSGTSTALTCKIDAPQGQVKIPTVQVDASNFLTGLQIGNLLPQNACSGDGSASLKNGYNYLCIYNGTDSKLIAQITYQYDTTANNIGISSALPGNGRITINIKDDKKDTANYKPSYIVCYGTEQAAIQKIVTSNASDCSGQQRQTSDSSPIVITGLTNDTTYYLTASFQGSNWTTPQPATPVLSYGFAESYNGAANPLSFSCQQTSAGPGIWVLFLGLLLFLRRHKIVLLLFASSVLLAHSGQLNFGVTGAPYKPALDNSTKPDGSAISVPFYKCMLNDKLAPLMGLEFGVHLLDDFGSLQLGMGVAYTYAGGAALLVANGQATCAQSNDPASLHILHLSPQVTYILDNWVEQFPLAPYVRGGLIATGYLFGYQGGIDQQGGANPMGVVFGWEAAAGLMLMLDFLQPSVSGRARANGSYEHIFLKAEAAYMPINNFHKNGLNFSPAWPTQDFPLMLTFGLVFEFN